MEVTLYDIALRFVGMKEVAGNVSNPMILAMLKLDQPWPEGDEVHWCSAALNWWAWLLRLPRSKSLQARSWLNVGKPIELSQAKVGFDIVVLYRGDINGTQGHVGLFAGRECENGISGRVLLLGGNQGDAVSIAPFSIQSILGVRRLYGD